ncbi:MAG: hypothetical protein Q9M28_06920 [Mariprofundaceae bacterium]|nr:hypothetical protein [Mariprofundaceae bacterium]
MYRTPRNIGKKLSLCSAAALLAFAVATPQQAQANSGAGATILNVATVNYKDASGTTSYAETATSSITVLLVAAAPSLLPLPADQTVASNGTATYTYTVSSNANGSAPYAITSTNGTKVNLIAGDTATPSINPIILGASVIVGVPAADQINIPAGSETNIIVGDILIIDTYSYEVSAITAGTAASHSNASATDGAAGTTTAETQTLITLIAHVAGSNTVPAFVVGNIGLQVGEQATFTVAVTATVGAATGDGSVITTTTVGTATPDDTKTTFQGVNVAITKEVSVNGTAFAATSTTGKPTDVLTYRITIVNNGSGNATSVVITDPMPDYTTYTPGTAKLDVTAAPVTYAAAATTLTDANVPATDTFDFAITAANTATYTAGTVAAGARVVLFYQVTID